MRGPRAIPAVLVRNDSPMPGGPGSPTPQPASLMVHHRETARRTVSRLTRHSAAMLRRLRPPATSSAILSRNSKRSFGPFRGETDGSRQAITIPNRDS